MKFYCLCLVLAQSILQCAWAAPLGSNELAAARSQGSNSLATLQGLITPSNFQLMGFASTNEVQQATNAEPLLIYTVPLNRLANYLPPNDFDSLLDPDPQIAPAPVTRVIIPILVATKVRSSGTLRLEQVAPGQPPKWTNLNWGYSGLIRNLVGTYDTIPSGQLRAGWSPFAVEIPVFDIWFIGYYNANAPNKLVLRSTSYMRVGPVTINSNQVITPAAMHQLAIMAKRYNGLPN